MKITLKPAQKIHANLSFAHLVKDLPSSHLSEEENAFLANLQKRNPEQLFFAVPRLGQLVAVILVSKETDPDVRTEECRRAGSKLADQLAEYRTGDCYLAAGDDVPFEHLTAMAEGLMLASYRFLPYLTGKNAEKQAFPEITLHVVHPDANQQALDKLTLIVRYTCFARDLVNEPPFTMNAGSFAERIAAEAARLGIRTEILGKNRIETLKMGGLLAVNRGSVDPPTFTILEYLPDNPANDRPVVLVGKGVIFDTGGMNLKTGSFMDGMKSDKAGAATMAAVTMAVAALQLPVHIVTLIPATDNRVDGNALLPGEVITMHDGTTVEVKNTDAEGRLILADALSYAKKLKPLLVIDAATLTGAAMRAIGHYGVVAMEEKAREAMSLLKTSGSEVYERIAEFPMWKEYDEQLRSDIADVSNLGSGNGGAITAARFLARFTDFPFIHLDIAGPAFIEKKEHYAPKGGTGTGVRLLIRFISNFIQHPSLHKQ
ncbi:MAG: peptidase M17 [Bacteroidales bacterium]